MRKTDYDEHLSGFMTEPLNGQLVFHVTNTDKNFNSRELFYYNDYITINEFNTLLQRHKSRLLSLETEYRMQGSVTAVIEFRDGDRSAVSKALGGGSCYSRKDNSFSNDLGIEDGYRIVGPKLYCLSFRAKNSDLDAKNFYWDHQCLTLPELNHILANHASSVSRVIPTYQSATEAFVLLDFQDAFPVKGENRRQLAKPKNNAHTRIGLWKQLFDEPIRDDPDTVAARLTKGREQVLCISSRKKTEDAREHYYLTDCITNKEYRTLVQRGLVMAKQTATLTTTDTAYALVVVDVR